jgi:hypothetical protein
MQAREKTSTISKQVIKSWFNDGILKKWQRIFFWTWFLFGNISNRVNKLNPFGSYPTPEDGSD